MMLGLHELHLEGFEVESVRDALRSPMTTRNKNPAGGFKGWTLRLDECG
jgi:hypothetical protein